MSKKSIKCGLFKGSLKVVFFYSLLIFLYFLRSNKIGKLLCTLITMKLK
ncbi:hypothetical protein HMPREF9108_00627 [Leptotrichia sp. oral taxon 225 str. F0581]|nr:hypothetical protein HMPREF9108_00627 [Leptotrichia sp. oral taxon 225 str. F0581]